MRCCLACLILLTFSVGPSHASECPPATLNPQQWRQLLALEFELPESQIQSAAVALLSCLASPDPQLRDEIAIGALTHWLRGKRVSDATAKTMLLQLMPRLHAADEQGFSRPFAALALAELARKDRIDAYLSAPEYDALLRAGSEYLRSVRDYRGFDEREGWRHGVAHGADLLMQLALNPRTTKAQLDLLLDSIATQVAPREHFYIYGEGARLARPVAFVATRKLHAAAEWTAWLTSLTASLESQQTQAALAQRHNLSAFLAALLIAVEDQEDAAVKALLLPPLREALKKI